MAREGARLRQYLSVTDDLSFLRRQARTQRFTLGTPKNFHVSPDGSRVLFQRSRTATDRRNNLYLLDMRTGEESVVVDAAALLPGEEEDRKSTRLNSSHVKISY